MIAKFPKQDSRQTGPIGLDFLNAKMVKVKKDASDFEIYENQHVIPVRVGLGSYKQIPKYGGIKEFQKGYKKWKNTRKNLPLLQV